MKDDTWIEDRKTTKKPGVKGEGVGEWWKTTFCTYLHTVVISNQYNEPNADNMAEKAQLVFNTESLSPTHCSHTGPVIFSVHRHSRPALMFQIRTEKKKERKKSMRFLT